MNHWFAPLCSMVLAASISFAADVNRDVLAALSQPNLTLRRHTAEVPRCVMQALRRWMPMRFVMVDEGRPFPPVSDIRRTGDGQFRLLFFSQLSPQQMVLCFEDNASLGRSYRAFFFSKRDGKCVVDQQFSLDRRVRSIKDLRAALVAASSPKSAITPER